MPEVNIPLLRKAVEWAEAEAAKPIELCRWEQSSWITDVEAQIWARERVRGGALDPVIYRVAAKAPECGTCYCIAGYVVEKLGPGIQHSVADEAASALGIAGLDASRLFHEDNTIEDVRRIAEEIAGESL